MHYLVLDFMGRKYMFSEVRFPRRFLPSISVVFGILLRLMTEENLGHGRFFQIVVEMNFWMGLNKYNVGGC